MRALLRCGLGISLLAGAASAELLHVRQSFGGFECLSCVESIAKSVKRLRGVESAEVNTKTSVVEIQLAEGNRVKLEAIRDAVKATGFTPGDATITAKGTLDEKQFVVAGSQQVFLIDGGKSTEGVVTVSGVSPASAAGEPLRLNVRELRTTRPLGTK